MKRNRNSFFTNYNSQSYFQEPSFNNPYQPYTKEQFESSYYQGSKDQLTTEFESRLTKLERQISRIESRLSKLESTQLDTKDNNYTNMYMI